MGRRNASKQTKPARSQPAQNRPQPKGSSHSRSAVEISSPKSPANKKHHVQSKIQAASNAWSPSTYTAFKALLSARLCSSMWNIIADCDETFNYWEPMHFLIYNSGFQTWEYSPLYAIRSYAYILLHAIPGRIYSHFFQSNKVLVFYFTRCVLAFSCAACEVYFYKAIKHLFGGSVARLTLAFLLFAPGMWISSTAFLPSSFSMYFTMLSLAACFLKNYPVSIVCVAISTFLGWPFAGILGISIAYKVLLIERKFMTFFTWSVLSVVCILLPVIKIDSHYFGKFVVAPLNIILYNVFSENGPELYGVSPWTYYFLNGFLNFNFVFLASLCVLPLVVISYGLTVRSKNGGDYSFLLPVIPMYAWILVFFTRPHKEERFLFPIYPLFCLCGAMALDIAQRLTSNLFQKMRRFDINILGFAFTILYATLSLSRSVALYRGYHAPFEVYMEVNRIAHEETWVPSNLLVNLCVGKEWYRYPSSFFLPTNWQLQFIQSEFRGQLPKPYSSARNATAIIPENMNERNEEEPSRYIDVKKCHFLVDLDTPKEAEREPRYSSRTKEWEVVFSSPFLDSEGCHTTFRSFYIPWLTDSGCTPINYNLLISKLINRRNPNA